MEKFDFEKFREIAETVRNYKHEEYMISLKKQLVEREKPTSNFIRVIKDELCRVDLLGMINNYINHTINKFGEDAKNWTWFVKYLDTRNTIAITCSNKVVPGEGLKINLSDEYFKEPYYIRYTKYKPIDIVNMALGNYIKNNLGKVLNIVQLTGRSIMISPKFDIKGKRKQGSSILDIIAKSLGYANNNYNSILEFIKSSCSRGATSISLVYEKELDRIKFKMTLPTYYTKVKEEKEISLSMNNLDYFYNFTRLDELNIILNAWKDKLLEDGIKRKYLRKTEKSLIILIK